MHPLLTIGAPGIDVSHYWPVTSFDELAKSDLKFFGVKATQGPHFVDSKLIYHRDGFRAPAFKNRLVVYYHFAGQGLPELQVDHFFASIGGSLMPNERVALDFEVLPTKPEDALKWVQQWYAALWHYRSQSAPHFPVDFIYTSKRIWDQFGNPDWQMQNQVALWAPRYNSVSLPQLPKPWEGSGFKVWQWSDGVDPSQVLSMPLAGVGPCDRNVWNGSAADLEAWMGSQVFVPSATEQVTAVPGLVTYNLMTDDELVRVKTFIESIQEERARQKKV